MFLRKNAFLSLLLITTTTAFTAPQRSFLTSRTHHKSTIVQSTTSPSSESETTKSSITNPTTAFGRPLTKEWKDFNEKTVTIIKETVFDTVFAGEDRDFARFYALETVARMPYFSYLSVLHLYETLGWWRKANYLKLHFAQSWNELHHLLIMEELGGDDKWADRFVAQHISVGYFWVVFFLYMYNPTLAYNLNQVVEEHAYNTYDTFLKENAAKLRTLPAPQAAVKYYRDGDLYMFDEVQTGTCEPRRPVCDTLYDTFVNIRDDEGQHVSTMAYLQTELEITNVHTATDGDGVCDIPPEAMEGL